jgi:hypothetical protein
MLYVVASVEIHFMLIMATFIRLRPRFSARKVNYREYHHRHSNQFWKYCWTFLCVVDMMHVTDVHLYLVVFIIPEVRYLLTYTMVQDMLWKSGSNLACQTTACFLHGTRKFITVLTKARHWTLSWASGTQFALSIPIFLRLILMLSSHLRIGLPSGLLSSGLPTKTVNTSLLPYACHMSCPPHRPWFNHLNNIRWNIQAVKFIITHFSLWSVFLPFRSKYPPQDCYQKPSGDVSPLMLDQVSHPYSTIDKITVLYILIFRFLDMRWKDKRFWTEW